ncbi:hypothetical protein GCM10028833_30140 [Glycomyces tarimensis]
MVEQLPDIDPPLEFGEVHTVEPADVHHVDDGILYRLHSGGDDYASDTVTAVAMATGETVAEVPLEHDVAIGEQPGQGSETVAFASFGDTVTLLHAYTHTPSVTGTEAETLNIRVRAFNVDDGTAAWTQDLEAGERGGAEAFLTIFDTTEDRIALAWGAHNDPTRSHLLDASTGESVWTSDEFTAVTVAGETIAAFNANADEPTAALIDLGTGEASWSTGFDKRLDGRSLGQGLVHFTAFESFEYDVPYRHAIVNAATGELVTEFTTTAEATCHFDQESVIACGSLRSVLLALDSTSGERLWDLDSVGADRELPTNISAAHRGVLYMRYDNDTRPPLALDARTGDDLVPELPADLTEVGPGYGLADGRDADGRRGLLIHLATG